jgi:PAS domain S-box-containing protein
MRDDLGPADRITALLRNYPEGLTISDISRKTKVHRTIVTKYLELMAISGNLRKTIHGRAKIYSLAQRVPLSELFYLHDDIVVVIDDSGRIVQANDAYARIAGSGRNLLKKKMITGSGLLLVDDPRVGGMLHREGPGISFETVTGDHRYRVRVLPVVLDWGLPGLVLIGVDITNTMAEHQKNRVQHPGNGNPAILFSRVLTDRTITYANDEMCRYLGRKYEDIIGKDLLTVSPQEHVESLRQYLGSFSSDNPVISAERCITDRDGNKRRYHWTVYALFNQFREKIGFQIVGYEITGNHLQLNEPGDHEGEDIPTGISYAGEVTHPPVDDRYRLIGERVHSLVPFSIVTTCSYNPGNKTCTIRSVSGDSKDLLAFEEAHGISLIGREFPMSLHPDIEIVANQDHLHEGPSLYYVVASLVQGSSPGPGNGNRPGKTYRMGFILGGLIRGHLTIQMMANQELVNKEFIEVFVNTMARVYLLNAE